MMIGKANERKIHWWIVGANCLVDIALQSGLKASFVAPCFWVEIL
jgi:hypothetical protein